LAFIKNGPGRISSEGGTLRVGINAIGAQAGETLALMGDPCEEYLICELAAQTSGAITCGIHPACSPGEFHYLMKNGQPSMFVAENQEHLDRILPILNNLPALRQIIVIDTKGTFGVEHPLVSTYEKLLQNGKKTTCIKPQAL